MTDFSWLIEAPGPYYLGTRKVGHPDAPTLSPSIDCDDRPCWHGHIVNGEVRP